MKENFTLFLSGVEPIQNYEVASAVTKNLLLSYYYIRRRGKEEIEERLYKRKGMKFLIDSGAHTFFNDPKYADKTVEWWEDYLKKYIGFIEKHRDLIFACVELDIGAIVGKEVLEDWRERYFHPLEESGIPVIYVYHLEDSLEDFTKLCAKHPYVGFSALEISKTETVNADELIKNLFNIAVKYKSKVHGFGVGSNKLLLNYPFYTADMTSWLTGSQFGEVNYFEGGKLKRLKKDQWKTGEYRGKLEALKLNPRLLDNEATTELQKASAIAFKKFEEYVRQVMLPYKYWDDRKMYVLPDYEWFSTEMEDWKEKLEAAGIDTYVPKSFGTTLLLDFYNFINDKDLNAYQLEDLVEICAYFGAEGVKYNTKDKCIAFLKKAFRECLNGERKDLQSLHEPLEGQKGALEREQYIQDEEYIEVAMTREECGQLLPALLTAGYDKDEVEKELIKNDITPVYDKDGNVASAVKRVRKQKKISTKAIARLSCDRCVLALNCPEYKAGYICAYDKLFRKFNTRKQDDVIDGLTSLADLALERVQKAYLQETTQGGVATDTTTELMDKAWGYLSKLKDLQNEVNGKPVTVSKTVVKGGTIENTVVKGSNPQSGGFLEQLLRDENVVEAEVVK